MSEEEIRVRVIEDLLPYMTTNIIRSYTASTPNDAELGKLVRKLITDKYGVTSKEESERSKLL